MFLRLLLRQDGLRDGVFNMAIAADATGSANLNVTSQTTLSWSHTCTGSNLILIVGMNSATGVSATGITYNSVALTRISAVTNSNRSELWYLLAPATGAHTVSATYGTSDVLAGISVSYTGAQQSGVPDAVTTQTAAVTSISKALTTVADNCWVIDTVGTGSDSGVLTKGASQTLRVKQAFNASMNQGMSDQGPKTPAGSVTMSWDTGIFNGTWSQVIASIAPAAGSSTAITGQYMQRMRGLGM